MKKMICDKCTEYEGFDDHQCRADETTCVHHGDKCPDYLPEINNSATGMWRKGCECIQCWGEIDERFS